MDNSDKLILLKQQSQTATEFRSHIMGEWITGEFNAYALCKICGKSVVVQINPAPNDIDIGGEAVALGCED